MLRLDQHLYIYAFGYGYTESNHALHAHACIRARMYARNITLLRARVFPWFYGVVLSYEDGMHKMLCASRCGNIFTHANNVYVHMSSEHLKTESIHVYISARVYACMNNHTHFSTRKEMHAPAHALVSAEAAPACTLFVALGMHACLQFVCIHGSAHVKR